MAYTAGRDIVFGTGKYAPETTEGKRLLAHELAHIQQQRGSILGAPPSVVQRQPTPSAPPPDFSVLPPGGIVEWFQEAESAFRPSAGAPSFRVRIVAHASPRWRRERDAADADRRNLELSQRRADTVRFEVEKLLAGHLGAGASVNVDATVEEQDPGTVGVEVEARGSRDTLLEVKGDRSDNALRRRRVDVIIESSQRVSSSVVGVSPTLTVPTASNFWHVSVDVSAGAAYGVAGSVLALRLTNDSTGQTMQGKVVAGGAGPKASLGATVSIWSDPTGFYNDAPVDFSDFDETSVMYQSGGVNTPLLGYEWEYLSFIDPIFGSDAQNIDVGGWNVGSLGIGYSSVVGKLWLDGPYPPTRRTIKRGGLTVTPYERTERGEDVHTVLFNTESATLNEHEVDILDSFLASVVASKR